MTMMMMTMMMCVSNRRSLCGFHVFTNRDVRGVVLETTCIQIAHLSSSSSRSTLQSTDPRSYDA